jgi:hypothetical protein
MRFTSMPFPTITASDPGCARLSFAKLNLLHPELLLDDAPINVLSPLRRLAYQVMFGDANPALVAAVRPDALIVSAYSGDIDCVVFLRFAPAAAGGHDFKPGDRLVALNSYAKDDEIAPDLTPGPDYREWTNYNPYIAEFMTDDTERVARLHQELPAWSWEKCIAMTNAALKSKKIRPRDGRPLRSSRPAE